MKNIGTKKMMKYIFDLLKFLIICFLFGAGTWAFSRNIIHIISNYNGRSSGLHLVVNIVIVGIIIYYLVCYFRWFYDVIKEFKDDIKGR